jgi:hypothetical protein
MRGAARRGQPDCVRTAISGRGVAVVAEGSAPTVPASPEPVGSLSRRRSSFAPPAAGNSRCLPPGGGRLHPARRHAARYSHPFPRAAPRSASAGHPPAQSHRSATASHPCRLPRGPEPSPGTTVSTKLCVVFRRQRRSLLETPLGHREGPPLPGRSTGLKHWSVALRHCSGYGSARGGRRCWQRA